DVSKSMSFGAKISKLDYAKTLAGCLSYLVHKQRDRIGLVTFDAAIVDHVPASAKHLDVVLHTLDRAQATRPGRLGPPLRRLAEHFGRRGIIVVLSDFYDEPDVILDAVGLLRSRGNDVALFHVLDPAEINFNFAEPSSFEDLESGDQIPIVPQALAEQYRALIAEHIETLTKKASEQRVDYMLLNTEMPLDFALFRFLSLRQRATRHR
ncbi:MAG: DUF58 domain-containing protein, partial [Vicinamibacterales bacterium]